MAKIIEKLLLEEILQDQNNIITIPIYQRSYEWDEKDIVKLANDLIEFNLMFIKEKSERYYLGNLLTRDEVNNQNNNLSNLVIIDGQQRITSVLLIIAALYHEGIIDNDEADKFLTVNSNKGLRKLKLNRMKDGGVISKILWNEISSINNADKETNVYKNYSAIIKLISSDKELYSNLYSALKRAVIVDVKIRKENETRVFETVNSTGKKLEPADLVKAFILFGVHNFEEHDAKRLEELFETEVIDIIGKEYDPSDFYRYYIAILGKKALVKRMSLKIYEQFKAINSEYRYDSMGDVEELIQTLASEAKVFDAIHNFKYTGYFNQVYKKIFDSNSKTYYSLAHYLFKEYVDPSCDNEEQMGRVMRIIAKISLFRTIGKLPDKNITQTSVSMFPDFLKYREGKSTSIDDFEDFVDIVSDVKNYGVPTYEEMKQEVQLGKHYAENQTKTYHVLLAYEVFLNRKEMGAPVPLENKFDIEHVFPQNNKNWEPFLSSEQMLLLISKLHNIGNLTLLSKKINSSISNSYYKTKRDGTDIGGKYKPGITEDVLRSSKYFNNVDEWDHEVVSQRAIDIFDVIWEHFNSGRDIPARTDVKLKSVVEGLEKTINVSTTSRIKSSMKYLEIYSEMKPRIEDVIPAEFSLNKPRPESWWNFSYKKIGTKKSTAGTICTRKVGKESIFAISIDWNSDKKEEFIHNYSRESEINELFSGEFKFKPRNKKGWGFYIELPHTLSDGITDELVEDIILAINELNENIDFIEKSR